MHGLYPNPSGERRFRVRSADSVIACSCSRSVLTRVDVRACQRRRFHYTHLDGERAVRVRGGTRPGESAEWGLGISCGSARPGLASRGRAATAGLQFFVRPPPHGRLRCARGRHGARRHASSSLLSTVALLCSLAVPSSFVRVTPPPSRRRPHPRRRRR